MLGVSNMSDRGFRLYAAALEAGEIVPEVRCLECDELIDEGSYCDDCREED